MGLCQVAPHAERAAHRAARGRSKQLAAAQVSLNNGTTHIFLVECLKVIDLAGSNPRFDSESATHLEVGIRSMSNWRTFKFRLCHSISSSTLILDIPRFGQISTADPA